MINIPMPEGTKAKMLDISFTNSKIKVALIRIDVISVNFHSIILCLCG